MANLNCKTNKVHLIITNRNIDTLKGYLDSNTLRNYLTDNCKFYGMILHNKDLTDDNKLKIPHIHIVFEGKNRKLMSTWKNDFADLFHIPSVLITINHAKDFVGNVRYLIHLDSADKYQYERIDVITNNVDALNDYFDSTSDTLSYDTLVAILNKSTHHWQVCKALGLSKYNYYLRVINILCKSLNIYLQ